MNNLDNSLETLFLLINKITLNNKGEISILKISAIFQLTTSELLNEFI